MVLQVDCKLLLSIVRVLSPLDHHIVGIVCLDLLNCLLMK